MTIETLVDLLNADLKNEMTHLHFYLQSACLVKGVHRNHLSEFFKKSADSEMEHVRKFGNMIIGLGFTPKFTTNELPSLNTSVEILNLAIQLEQEVVSNYTTRIQQADELGGADGKWISLFLEEQLEDSRSDLDNLRQMIQ